MSWWNTKRGRALLTQLSDEAESAQERYGPFASTHEGLGVLTEEYQELIEAIRSNDLKAVEREAIQVAAVAARIAESLSIEPTIARSQR